MAQYLPLLVFVALAVGFGAISRVASGLLAPRRRTLAKEAPYECGIVPRRDSPERFPVRFYLVAMIFIVFDVEVIFFFPWATVFRGLGAYGLIAIVLFSVLVFESFVYLIGNGALEWGPVKRLVRNQEPMQDPSRTPGTTIKRVGMDGREVLEPTPAAAEAASVEHAA
jgi:NADH-quinone oxidoreductase subunit A